jgi:hypothetical protein
MAPIIPFIPSIIGGVGSAVGGWLGGRKGKEEKAAEAALAEQAGVQTEAMREGLGLGKKLAPMATSAFRRGIGTTQGAVDYWRRILSGKTGATEMLAPEINQIINSYRQARIAGRTLNPRGAGATEFTRRIDEEIVPGQISGLLATARPEAAAQLGTLGPNLASLGLTGLGTTGQLFGQGAGAGSALLQYGAQNRQQGWQFGQDLAKLLEPIGEIILKKWPPVTAPTPTPGPTPGPPPPRGPTTNPGGEWGE